MSKEQLRQFIYKHCDHDLRQFRVSYILFVLVVPLSWPSATKFLAKVLHRLKQRISKTPLHKVRPKYPHSQEHMEHLAYHCLP